MKSIWESGSTVKPAGPEPPTKPVYEIRKPANRQLLEEPGRGGVGIKGLVAHADLGVQVCEVCKALRMEELVALGEVGLGVAVGAAREVVHLSLGS